MQRGTTTRPSGRRRGRRRDGFEVLRVIAEATATSTGQAFFNELVCHLAAALDAKCAFVSDFSPDYRTAHVRAFWMVDHLVERPFDYDVPGTPCELVLAGEIVAFDRDVQALFPLHRQELAAVAAESYLAIPLRTPSGQVCGHLAVIDSASRNWHELDFGILRIFAARATAELERREYEQTLEGANRELAALKDLAEAANRAKSDFLASMSHELRTPLNGVLGYAQILKRDPSLDGSQQSAVSAIERCGEHLLMLISDVLDLAKIEAGKLDLHVSTFDLSEFIDGLVDLGRVQAGQKELAFGYECNGILPRMIAADERRVRQVLLNLMGNAIKFTDRGAVTLRVASAPLDGDRVRLRFDIEDTGIGIAESDMARIFEMFQQAGARRQRIEGAGLGLAISRRLAELMDGGIRVRSTLGMGSRFTFELPVGFAAETPRPVRSAQRIVGYQGPRRRVLVVDDIADNREILARLLDKLGFDVFEAADGHAALETALQRRPDLIFMDLVMPELDGFESARRMHQNSALAAVPIIALSASAFDRTRDESLSAGFHAFLPKPLRFDDVLDTMGQALRLAWITESVGTPRQRRRPGPASAPADLAGLLELARRGDIRGIQQQLGELERDRRIDPALLSRLRSLAASYDMKGIRVALAAANDKAEGTQ